ncbi:hypothetical protein OG894_40850 [Streptomyces sp. NBC_01724]|uniref:hypothetical protein n=1 Tax=unclassified Streptomyces TaxID=2593676 RepID=UPI002DD9697D|nr:MULTISPECIES: hypothetical protein [unclassified Streptomyces]WSC67101.1 hypothetical protein OG807_00860 [Streptomyces sp. NBC_01760]WTE49385.1 hypothetical protein OG987_00940 [Streptomyces sp. NBC_01620]
MTDKGPDTVTDVVVTLDGLQRLRVPGAVPAPEAHDPRPTACGVRDLPGAPATMEVGALMSELYAEGQTDPKKRGAAPSR